MKGPHTKGLYMPIDSLTRREIRVLELLPAISKSKVKCRVRVVSLTWTVPPRYEALSYTWGSSSMERSIVVYRDDSEYNIQVTNNLYDALCCLQPRQGRPRILWVDALCINQYDDSERAAQVAMMGEIYHTAARVNIWLGKHGIPLWKQPVVAFSQLSVLTSKPLLPFAKGLSKFSWHSLRRLLWLLQLGPNKVECSIGCLGAVLAGQSMGYAGVRIDAREVLLFRVHAGRVCLRQVYSGCYFV